MKRWNKSKSSPRTKATHRSKISAESRKPQARQTPRVKDSPSESSQTQILPVTITAEYPPIENPEREKYLIETGDSHAYYGYLRGRIQSQERPFAGLTGELGARISEVYRLCSRGGERTDIIKDFVANCPSAALNCPWLSDLVRLKHRRYLYDYKGDVRNRLFEALEAGFRRAANPLPPLHRFLTREGGRIAKQEQNRIKKELSQLARSSGWSLATDEWKNERAANVLDQYLKGKSVDAPQSEKIKAHIVARRYYEASVLIAHLLYKVPERTLQAKSAD